MNTGLEQYLIEEQQRRFEDQLSKQALLREARAARAAMPSRPGLLRRGTHYLGVGLVRVGEQMQIQCREAMSAPAEMAPQSGRTT